VTASAVSTIRFWFSLGRWIAVVVILSSLIFSSLFFP